MAKPMKTYNPPERFCAQCGHMIITHDPGAYQYKIRLAGKGKTLWFCKPSCMEKFRKEHPIKEHRRMPK